MAVVNLDQITKRYPGSPGSTPSAVDAVSLPVRDGEFMILLGPSGCGKSTTLRMIAGLESITSGTLSIDGSVVNRVPARDRDIAMVFQSYALYPHMTVYDNLAFGLRRRKVSHEDLRRRVQEVAATLGLEPYLKRKPFSLSGGQRQRVALGRAIVRNPKVFLFDEPLSNLDASLRVKTRNELIRTHQRLRATMIYVTHDQVEAMTMGTRICVMNLGKVVQTGSPLDVYREPADTFVASFIGSPPMNLLDGELTQDAGRLNVRFAGKMTTLLRHSIDDLSSVADGKVIVGIRPEDIYALPPANDPERYTPVRATVLACEALGSETLLVMSNADGQNEWIVRAGRDALARSGDSMTVYFDLGELHLFDPRTTKRIRNSSTLQSESPISTVSASSLARPKS